MQKMISPRPHASPKRGVREVIQFAAGECSLGRVLVAATDEGICAIQLGDAPEPLVAALRHRFPKAELKSGGAGFERVLAEVIALVEEPKRAFDLPLHLRGTPFQQEVWDALRSIPAGETRTYAEIAAKVGRPGAARAVAGAIAANGIAVAVPCHRVIGAGGALCGYRWGVDRKAALLTREGAL